MTNIREWFSLKDDRDNFLLTPTVDGRFYFGRAPLDKDIQGLIRRSFRANRPVKLFVFGDFGSGKTHTLNHIRFFLEQNATDYPAAVFTVECGDIDKKTRFDMLQGQILDAIGLQRVQDLVQQFAYTHSNLQADFKQLAGGSSDIATAFATLIAKGVVQNTAWSWLRGMESDGSSIGLSGRLAQSKDFVAVLQLIGHLFWEVEHKRLILLVDELQKVEKLEDPAAEEHWLQVMRQLAGEAKSVGFIFSIGANTIDRIPNPLSDRQVISRVGGEDHYIPLKPFLIADARDFLGSLLSAIVDPAKLSVPGPAGPVTALPGFNAATYPFTQKAFDEFAAHVTQDPNEANPRRILAQLERVAEEAMDREERQVSETLLRELGMA